MSHGVYIANVQQKELSFVFDWVRSMPTINLSNVYIFKRKTKQSNTQKKRKEILSNRSELHAFLFEYSP